MRRLASAGALAFALLLGSCASRYPVDGERAHARVVTQVEFGSRVPGTAGHRATQKWIADEIDHLGGRLERQTFVDTTLGRPLELTNLIARFGPEHGRRILLAAHYDTRPFCDQDPDTAWRDRPVPGANDGGSGVAVLLEVAELLHRRAPEVGVDLVFFDGEDQGRAEHEYSLGARGYARRLPPPGSDARPVAGFLFDMVGDKDLGIYAEATSAARAANLVALVTEAAAATGARGFRSEVRHTVIDDHIPLIEAGLPTVDIIDFDYPAWHTHADLPDQVSAGSLAEVARVAAWLVYRSPLGRP